MRLKPLQILTISAGALLVSFGFQVQQVMAVASSSQPVANCQNYQPIDTQFRLSGRDSAWVNGAELTKTGITSGTHIDVNCFAQNGGSLLPGGYIELRYPNGVTGRISNSSELRNFTIPELNGTYVFACESATLQACGNSDTITIKSTPIRPPQPVAPPVVTPTPTPKPTPTPQPAHHSSCQALKVVGGNNSMVPAKVTLRASGEDNKGTIQRYKYYFGDGSQHETDQAEVQHNYESSGQFVARVDVKDSQGNWKSSASCETTINVKSASIESHKSDCSDLYLSTNSVKAPSTITFRVTGYDNKGSIKGYKVDFGNGIIKESDGQTFEQRYEKAGTYQVKAYVKDSQNNWQGGDENCSKPLYLETKPLTKQPETGTSTVVSGLAVSSGAIGSVIELIRRRRK